MKEMLKKYVPNAWMEERRRKQKVEMLKTQEEPKIYNAKGEIKRVFFLKDTLSQHTPYTFILGQEPDSILWDRNNVGLPIHFYTHEAMFEPTFPYAKKKFGLLFESELIRPDDFSKAMQKEYIIGQYQKIFTFSERILEKYDNALFAPASGLWYGTSVNGGAWDESLYEKKEKNISVIASNKQGTEYHKLRVQLAKDAMNTGKVDAYGAFCNNHIEKKADALMPYRYSIVVENDVKPFYFTEKIMDCFASMTVPIYVGATELGKYFNMDGVITVKPSQYDHVEDILKQCNQEDYESRINAIKDNFERVKQFRCIEDYIMNHYAEEFTW